MSTRILFIARVNLALLFLKFLWQPCISLAMESEHSQTQKYIVRYVADDQDTLELDDFCHRLNEQKIKHTVIDDMWNTAPHVIKLATFELHNKEHVGRLKNIPGVAEVTPVRKLEHPSATAINQTPVKPSPGNFGPHIQARIDQLHKRGVFGAGIRVALIDSGVDCAHPAFGNGFGPGKKIAFGYDFVGDDYNGFDPPQTKADPCTPCGTHGTHTSGIIAASDVGFGFTGVAPNATLGMYLFGCKSQAGSTNALMIQALLKAYNDGAHIISASVGGVGGWAIGDSLTATVDALANKGVIIVLAVGNEGEEGVFYTESPASSVGVISVGWVQSATTVVTAFLTSTGKQLYYHSAGQMTGSKLALFVNSPNTTVEDDACHPLGDQTPNLQEVVILVKRGTCPFSEKLRNIAEAGGRRVLFYMDKDDIITLESRTMGMEVATISNPDGLYLAREAAKNRDGFTVDFPASPLLFAGATDAGFINNASNYGPSYDFRNLQPSLVGVGGNVISTVPVAQGSYSAMSGSSMATPQVAGVIALILSARRKPMNGFQMKALLSTTSQLVSTPNTQQVLESAIHQGGGLINAYCAAYTNTLLSTSSLALKDLQHFNGVHSFTITNFGSQVHNYKLQHHPAQTLASFKPGSYLVSTSPLPMEGNPPATLEFDADSLSFQLGPGATKKITVRFSPPKGLDQSTLPIYSGFLHLATDAECESHNLPYYGVYGILKAQKYIDYGADTAPFAMYKVPRVANSKRLPVDKAFSMQGDDMPVIRYRLAMGSPVLQMDLADANATLNTVGPPVLTSAEISLGVYDNLTLTPNTFRGVRSLGRISGSNATFSSRTAAPDTMAVIWDGKLNPFSNLTAAVDVPSGTYKILLRVLRINGQPTFENDWEAWLSPAFTIDRTVPAPSSSADRAQPVTSQSGPSQQPIQTGNNHTTTTNFTRKPDLLAPEKNPASSIPGRPFVPTSF